MDPSYFELWHIATAVKREYSANIVSMCIEFGSDFYHDYGSFSLCTCLLHA